MTINLTRAFNWDAWQIETESQIAIDHINDFLSREHGIADATKLYAQTLVEAIVDLKSKDKKTDKDYGALLKYLKELEGVISIKSKLGFRMTPAEDVVFSQDDLTW